MSQCCKLRIFLMLTHFLNKIFHTKQQFPYIFFLKLMQYTQQLLKFSCGSESEFSKKFLMLGHLAGVYNIVADRLCKILTLNILDF